MNVTNELIKIFVAHRLEIPEFHYWVDFKHEEVELVGRRTWYGKRWYERRPVTRIETCDIRAYTEYVQVSEGKIVYWLKPHTFNVGGKVRGLKVRFKTVQPYRPMEVPIIPGDVFNCRYSLWRVGNDQWAG